MMKRLGDYIRPVDVRNRDLKVTRLVGLTIDKAFIPSVANTIGTDLSNYKVISENQFACSLMQVSRDGKMPIAMFKGEPCIMSPAYPMFEVSKKNELLPEYLMMWFSRSEFDREASFYAVGGVRGSLEWNDFCDMQIPVPAIEKQRETVAEYNTLATRIETNKKLIATLEQTAQTLYRHTFVDNIDPNNLPQGWRMGTLGEIAEITSGKTCVDKKDVSEGNYKYPVAGASGIIGYSNEFNQDERLMTTGRVGTLGIVNRYNERLYTADNVLVIKAKFYEYCYQILNRLDYAEITKGGVQSLITQTDLKNISINIPTDTELKQFEITNSKLFEHVKYKIDENQTLTQMQTLLLSKMGNYNE